MLFTRCPDCDTTFRVTDEVLKKANGQVRCGRCASVFNALAELRRTPDDSSEPPTAAAEPSAPPTRRTAAAADESREETAKSAELVARGQQPAQPPSASPVAPDPSGTPRDQVVALDSTGSTKPARGEPDAQGLPRPESAGETIPVSGDPAADERLGALVADVVAQVERGGAALEDADTSDLPAEGAIPQERTAITAAEVDAVLTSDTTADAASNEALAASILAWPATAQRTRRSRLWGVAAFCAMIVLGLQVMNHFRSDLVKNSAAGPIIRNAYGLFGVAITPHWDVHQYAILDWVANAEPNLSGRGTLKITARIQNRGPLAQPHPSVQLRFKDRWEAAVGSRIFKPSEYLDRSMLQNVLMAPGTTVRAQLEVVDPGPDAYGFDLDVCIEVETDVLSCGSDKVFL